MCDKKQTPDKTRPSPEADGSVTIPVNSEPSGESTEQVNSEPTKEGAETPTEEDVLFALSKENDQLARALEEAYAEREALLAKLEEATAEREELRGKYDQAARSISVYDEQRKRAEKARDEALQFGSADLLKELMPVRDDLALALKASEMETASVEDMRIGLEGIVKKMDAAFENADLEPIEPAKGEPMDPNAHQATGEVPFPVPGFKKGDVMEVQQRGYLLRGRVLRYADVIVAGADAEEPVEPDAETEVAPEGGLSEESAENSTKEDAEETEKTAESDAENSTEKDAEETNDNETEA